MATEKQIEAARRNGALGKGPSELGKSRSRLNATKHGMTAQLPEVEAAISPEFADRRSKWAAEQQPVGEGGEWALDRAVAASFRIERCERSVEDLIADVQQRARLAWEEDRAVEAATTFGRLARDPILASRQLQTTLAGVVLLIEAWLLLVAALESGDDWSEADCSRALDLLGVDADRRSGRTAIDDDEESSNLIAFRLGLVMEEVDRLEVLRDEAMIPLDELERRHAIKGDVALLSKRARLLLRYEREAWKHFNQSMKEVKGQAPTPAVAPAPKPIIVAPPRPVAPPKPSFEEQRRALQAEGAPLRKAALDPLIAMGLSDEDAWLDALEKRIEALHSLPDSYVAVAAGSPRSPAPERTQFGGVAAGPEPSRILNR
jgi:hypothetical protein